MLRRLRHVLLVAVIAGLLGGCVMTSHNYHSNTKVQIKDNPNHTSVKIHTNEKHK